VRAHWWRAVATVARLIGDLEVAEEAVQEACVAALEQWGREGVPEQPAAWLIGTARHKALDWQRREIRRLGKERQAVREWRRTAACEDDQLALIFACCHPALDARVRVPLTLRAVCGFTTGEIAEVFLVPEPAMAQRLVRAKRKIRDAGIPLRVPSARELPDRLDDVLEVVYLVYTEGHRAARGAPLVRPELCEEAIRLARDLARLMPREPEVVGLLALSLLTDARRATRTDAEGRIVLLGDQDRDRWDAAKLDEGARLTEHALRMGRAGPYQLQAAIAACHAGAPSVQATDWPQITALYTELLRLRPSAVVAANRAVAIAMSEGPAAALAIVDELIAQPQTRGWAPVHVARANFLERLGRTTDALAAYRAAAALSLAPAERELIAEHIMTLARCGPDNAGAGSPQRRQHPRARS
jgi:RNA polymerase sigma-70 factor, ECF subfamily